MLIHYKALSLSVAVAMTAGGLLAAAPVEAQEAEPITITAPLPTDIPAWRVGYRDLNLTLAPHRVTLIRRVTFAVDRVCELYDVRAEKTLRAQGHFVDCRKVAWSRAQPQMAAAINRAWARAGYRAG